MTEREIIRGRLDYARAWLDSALPRLTQEMLTWVPTEGMRTISGQLIEIISVEAQLVPVLKDGKELTDDELASIIEDPNSLDTLRRVLAEVRERTFEFLGSLSDDQLKAEVSVPQWYGAYWPKPCPCGEHFRNIAEHEFYHAGQLISYLWARGDDPYNW